MYLMNIILALLSLLCIVLLANLLYKVILSVYRVFASSNSPIAKDDFTSTKKSIQNAEADFVRVLSIHQNMPTQYVVFTDMAIANQIEKRIHISDDFIKGHMFFIKEGYHLKNPVIVELVSLFFSERAETLAILLPNNTDFMLIELRGDSNNITSVIIHGSLLECPKWVLRIVYAAEEIALEQKSIEKRQKAAQTKEMLKIFQASYDALSPEDKKRYTDTEFVKLKIFEKNYNFEESDLASYIFLVHAAVEHDDVVFLELLKANGVNFDIPDNKGCTPAHYAAENGFNECLEILKAAGANFDIPDNIGYTPAHYAAQDDFIECLEILKAAGANFNILSKIDYTPAHCAAYWGYEVCLELLKSGGANFNIQNKVGDTPAHYAAKNGYAECLRVLKISEANFDIPNIQNETAKKIALNKGIDIDDL